VKPGDVQLVLLESPDAGLSAPASGVSTGPGNSPTVERGETHPGEPEAAPDLSWHDWFISLPARPT
jgi:hypothetical protein